MTSDYTVLTPERVALEYGVAGIGSRGGAVIIDTGLQVLGLGVLGAGVFGAAVAIGSFGISLPAGVYIAAIAIGLFAITSGYFMLFEIVWSGQTPGKRLFGLRVIRESGYPLRPIDAVIRNLVRIADWLPLLYGIGVLVMLLNQRSRRLGDFAAGTLVVREGARAKLSTFSSVERNNSPAVALSPADATLVRDFLVRRNGMAPAARNSLAARLATVLANRYGLPLEDDAERFLERLTL
jgi:uncharacterized RDD family membrane protein YckC